MFEFQTIFLFVAASTALALAPGPDNIFVLTQSALHGRVAGWSVTLGLCTGLFFHCGLVAFGVAATLASSPIAYTALKSAGACYLLYLAWGTFRASPLPVDAASAAAPGQAPAIRKMYLRGILMNVTNPKVAIFFLAFLPGFAEAGEGPMVMRLLALGGYFLGVTLVVFGAVAWGAGFLGEWLQGSVRGQLIINRVAALVFVALALHLLASEQGLTS